MSERDILVKGHSGIAFEIPIYDLAGLTRLCPCPEQEGGEGVIVREREIGPESM